MLAVPALASQRHIAIESFDFGVISDPHYFPTEFNGTRASAYQDQTSGDLRLMGENEALTTAAVDQMLAAGDLPRVLIVTGDLSSEGEKASHEGFASQMKRLQQAGCAVLVIPGNHDVYNYDAMSFQSDEQVKDGGSGDLWTTEADFRSIYASMGYDERQTIDASNDEIVDIVYYKDVKDGGVADCQGGLSYIAVTKTGVAFVMIDTEIYTADANGKGKAWGQGKGMISDDLLAWIQGQAKELTGKGYTLIAGVHHPVLNHQATSETEFVTDTAQIQDGVDEAGVMRHARDYSFKLATALADAGIHYVYSGHMHENDVATYTAASGSVLYDIETGGLCAYPSPYRTCSVSVDETGDISLSTSSTAVESAAMNARLDAPNGAVTDTEKVDVLSYEKAAMYGDKGEDGKSFITRLVMRYADRYLSQLSDIPAALEGIAGVDLFETLHGALPGLLGTGVDVDLGGSVGKLHITYSTGSDDAKQNGVHLNPSSGAAAILGSVTIYDEDLDEEIQSVLDQIERNYIANGRLDAELSKLLESVGDVNMLNPANPADTSGECYTLRQLLQDMFWRHNSGFDAAAMPQEMERALENLASSPLLANEVESVLSNTLLPLIDEVLGSTTVNLSNLFHGNAAWTAATTAVFGDGPDPHLSVLLEKFGLDLTGETGLVRKLLGQYVTESVYGQIGGLVRAMIVGFATDADGLDDAVGGSAIVLAADADPEPNPTVENGCLPSQVTVSLGVDESGSALTTRNFNWYTGTGVADGQVQLVEATGGMSTGDAESAMDAGEGVTRVDAETETVDKPKVTLNLVLVTNYETVKANKHCATVRLEAGKSYYYRVGSASDGYWSEPVKIEGASASVDEGYTALVVADSQGASKTDYDAYAKVLGAAEAAYQQAEFALHLGDMVDDGSNENYWSWLLDTDESRSLAFAPVAGNHEARAKKDLPNAVAAHYHLDLPDQDTSTGVYYSYVYGDVTYIVLNTNDGDGAVGEAQRTWATGVAQNATTTWKVLVTHKAAYSKGSHQGDADVAALRSWLDEWARDNDIDLVLSGHDHTYMRTSVLAGGSKVEATTERVTDSTGAEYTSYVNPKGSIFVVPATSGTKYYDYVDNDVPTEVSGQPYQSMYSALSIEGDTLFWKSYTYDVATGASALYDSFAITKRDDLSDVDRVMALIDALPKAETVTSGEAADAARPAVEEARSAYEALSEEDRLQVSNVHVLEQLEAIISAYSDLADGVCDLTAVSDEGERRDMFKRAVADEGVGTIIFPASGNTAMGTYSGNTLNNQYYDIDRDLVIKCVDGVADIRRLGLRIKDGATLILENVTIQSWQKKPTFGTTTPMCVVQVFDGTLIANGDTSIKVNLVDNASSGFKNSEWRGHAIVVGNIDGEPTKGSRAVYLNTTGTISGLRDSVVQQGDTSLSSDKVVIGGGTYETLTDGLKSVNVGCDLSISGGEFTSIGVSSGGKVAIDGAKGLGDGSAIPVVAGDGVEVFASSIDGVQAHDGKVFQLGTGAKLHVGPSALEELGAALELDAGVSADGFVVTASGAGLGDAVFDGSQMYAVDRKVNSFPAMAQNTAGAQETQVAGAELSSIVKIDVDASKQVYAKYHVAGDSALAQCAEGDTSSIYAYSGYTAVSNPAATVSIGTPVGGPLIVQSSDGSYPTVDLNASVRPANAMPLVAWTVEPADAASVSQDGVVSFAKAGAVRVVARHITGSESAIALTAARAELGGSDVLSSTTSKNSYEMRFAGADGASVDIGSLGYSVRWSVAEGDAASIASTGAASAALSRADDPAVEGDVTIEATLLYNGSPVGTVLRKTVRIEPGRGSVDLPDSLGLAGGVYTGQGVGVTEDELAAIIADEEVRAGLAVAYRLAGSEEWSTELPVHAGSYDIRLSFGGSASLGAFERVYDSALVISPAQLTVRTAPLAADVSIGSKLDEAVLSGGEVELSGDVVEGSWGWVDGSQNVTGDSSYEVVFAPASHAEDYQKLTVCVDVATYTMVKVVFDPAGGELEDEAAATREVRTGSTLDDLPTPTRAGFTFAGWVAEDGSAFVAGDVVLENMALKAVWSEKPAVALPDELEVSMAWDEGADIESACLSLLPDELREIAIVEYRRVGEREWTRVAPSEAGVYDLRVSVPENEAHASAVKVYGAALAIEAQPNAPEDQDQNQDGSNNRNPGLDAGSAGEQGQNGPQQEAAGGSTSGATGGAPAATGGTSASRTLADTARSDDSEMTTDQADESDASPGLMVPALIGMATLAAIAGALQFKRWNGSR